MSWKVAIRALAIALGAANAGLAVLQAQGADLISPAGRLAIAVALAAIGFVLAALPSAAGVSSLAPERETTLLRKALNGAHPVPMTRDRRGP